MHPHWINKAVRMIRYLVPDYDEKCAIGAGQIVHSATDESDRPMLLTSQDEALTL